MNRIIYSILVMALLITSCSPIESDESLGGVLSVDEVKARVEGITPGSNKIILINETPGVAVYWNYVVGASTRQVDTVLLPFLGTTTIKLTALCDGGQVTKDIPVNVDKIDYPLDIVWNLLTGDGQGKTWVWATGREGDVLFGNGGLNNFAPAWWLVDKAEIQAAGYLFDEMTFDLLGGANYTLVKKGIDGAGSQVVTDQFILDVSKKGTQEPDNNLQAFVGMIKTGNRTPFIRDESFIPDGAMYQIIKLTEDELTLMYANDPGGWDSYFWMFKRKGYVYPSAQ